ncbi:GNAT family N-acetyltransferase [Deinococcus taeanensis]|uniref:GNAT family N-acetyltransferase n=1 Tax=Deinococcus taeanensis TaxID=2737050 RepID=UPI001CDBDC5E|nr:GNAT family N-acetyltransferase [Deinococcus taeanensis]UBV43781.1 GNAT family N-acetyltransferase [Deinococcus taeanensis]
MTTSTPTVMRRDRTQFTEEFTRQFVTHLNELRRESNPGDPAIRAQDIWGQLQHLPAMVDMHIWTVEDDTGIHAHARTQMLNLDTNRHVAELDVMVAPAWRHRGLGRDLLRQAAQFVQTRGRTLLLTRTVDRVPAGEAFAVRAGFERGQVNRESRLMLTDIPDGLLDRWTARPDDDYSIEFWLNGTPDAQLTGYATLLNVMNSAPRDDLNVEDTHITAKEVQEMEQLSRAGGRTLLTAVVRAPNGELVGLNELSWREARPEIVAQGNTGVLPEHRGHGLGRWLKGANVKELARHNPGAREIRTQNAESNSPMLKINTDMGFRPFIAATVWQGDVHTVLARLKKE